MSYSPVAIVTGAARGIGLATTKRFLAAGWRVAMVDRDAPELALASEPLTGILPLPYDVSVPRQVDTMVADTLAEWGQIDALINNAGVADFGPIEETGFARWRTVMETNLDGVFLCSQAATPALKDTRGAIVNIASISGLRASTLRVAYGTSKAAVMHLTRQQAAELGEHGIRVNCVCPGPVRTKLAMAVHSQAIIDAYHDAIPLNRYGSEDEIAAVIAFLCSPEASYVTGQIIAADGGFEATAIGLPALRGLAENAEGPCREYGRVMRMERIGVLGLGRMGSAMARKLAASGATVTGWTRSARTVDGVAAAPDLAALVQASDTLILSLYDDAAVTEMLDALLQHDLAGRLILETSTVVPQILIDRAGAFAAKGAQVADAPVSGGPEMVAAGTCGFFVGADPEVAERAMPVLTAISPRVLHMGSLGVGMAMKTINNAMLQIYIAGLCEMLPIAKRAGISMEDALGVLISGPAGTPFLRDRMPRITGADQTVGFTLNGIQGDNEVFRRVAESYGFPSATLEIAGKGHARQIERGLGAQDPAVAIAAAYRDA